MAEAGPSNTPFSNICPFCDLKLNNQFQLGKHLLEVHNICVNTTLKRKHEEDSDKEPVYFSATANSDTLILGNKMKILRNILKENFPEYTEKLKEWINCAISRTEFDQSVRPFFNAETIVVHNEFLICFLNEIRSINKGSTTRKRCSFIPQNGVNPEENPSSTQTTELLTSPVLKATTSIDNKVISGDVKNSTRKRTFPDEETMYALAIVYAWENGCSSVNKKIVPMVQKANEEVIKIIHNAILTRRKNLKVRPDGSEYNVTKVDPKDTSPEDRFKYSGAFDVREIFDALRAEPNIFPFKSMCKVVLHLMKYVEKRRSANEENT